jgi:hypothetical protein
MPRKLIALSSIVGVLALLLASSLSSVRADETPEPARTPATHTATPKPTDKPTLAPTMTILPSPTLAATPTGTPPPTEPAIFMPTPTTNPLEGIVRVAQTQPGLTIAGAAGCLVVLIALVILFILSWRRRKRGAPPLATPYLELESTGLRIYLKRDALTLGRASDCDLRIAENLPGADTVSHQHARFVKRDARWVVVDGIADDQPSTNGIYVNGKRTLENYLDEGDEIAFGELKFRFHIPTTGLPVSQGDAR